MIVEYKEIITFEPNDTKIFAKWKDKKDLSYRSIAKELCISCSYLVDMVSGRRSVNGVFKDYLIKNGLYKDNVRELIGDEEND